MTTDPAVALLKTLFMHTVNAAAAGGRLSRFLPAKKPQGRVVVVGAGKAAAAMAAEWERIWPYADIPLEGCVITRHWHGAPTRHIRVLEAGHPIPDEAGPTATEAILNAVSGLSAEDTVYCLLSGGASALLTLPGTGICSEEKRAVNRQLLSCGASIDEINTVRKHLSAVKGGRLALKAAPASVITLAVSDVPGDDISVIGSGPTVADPTTAADALAVIRRYRLDLPPAVMAFLQTPAAETPKNLPRSQAHLIATADSAFSEAVAEARKTGLNVLYLGDRIEGEAREAARVMAGIALHMATGHGRVTKPALILSGGETTVTVRHPGGRGGRNSEFLLALAVALKGAPGIYALAADTDGIDGSEDNAGAFITPDTLNKAVAAGLDAQMLLDNNRAYDFFAGIGSLVVTGPTLTNINDFRAILIL